MNPDDTDDVIALAPPDEPEPPPPPKPVETGPPPTCPSCKRELESGAKICVECGIVLKTGRTIITTQDENLNDIYAWAQRTIWWISWVFWLGLYPIASEAFGTRKPYVVRTIAIITIVASVAYWFHLWGPTPSPALDNLMLWGGSGQVAPELADLLESAGMTIGEFHPYQLLTHALLHADPLHLIGNLLFLMVLGTRVNSLVGNYWTMGLYPLFAVAAGVAELISGANGPPHPMLGASGAIMGMAGMYIFLFPAHKVHMAAWCRWGLIAFFRLSLKLFAVRGFWVVMFYIAFDVLATILGAEDGVAHWAHLGGFIAGMAVALLLLVCRLINARGGDLLSVTLGHRAALLIGNPNRPRPSRDNS